MRPGEDLSGSTLLAHIAERRGLRRNPVCRAKQKNHLGSKKAAQAVSQRYAIRQTRHFQEADGSNRSLEEIDVRHLVVKASSSSTSQPFLSPLRLSSS
jgi:hypothetical protein